MLVELKGIVKKFGRNVVVNHVDLTIGDGDIDFAHVIRRMSGYRGNWIIESKSMGSAVQSLPRLQKMLS